MEVSTGVDGEEQPNRPNVTAIKILVVRPLNSCAYSTCYPRQMHACEASRSAHYAVASQTCSWRRERVLLLRN